MTEREPDRMRLFYALDLPDSTISTISTWQREQLRGEAAEGLRAVRPAALHLTLVFVGSRPRSEAAELAGALEGLGTDPVEALLRPEPVPVPRRRPRLLALEVESAGAEALAEILAERLAGLGVQEGQGRPFWPHLTVFRARGSGRERSRRRRLPRVDPFADGDGHAFGFVRVALYRSDLRPDGAVYSRLAANELPQPGGRQKR